jgi:hypothetical protein
MPSPYLMKLEDSRAPNRKKDSQGYRSEKKLMEPMPPKSKAEPKMKNQEFLFF